MHRFLKELPPKSGFIPLLAALLLWQLLAVGPSPNFPPPLRWVTAIYQLAQDGPLLAALSDTLVTFLIGLAAAALLGFVLGLLIGTSKYVRNGTSWVLEFLRATPPPVLVPIAVLVIGYTSLMKVFIIAIAALWPILLNTVSGVGQIGPVTMDVSRALRLSWSAQMFKIIIPASIPSFLIGMRSAVPLAIIITLLVEMLTGIPGLGFMMISSQRNFNSPQVFGLLVLVGLVGFLLNYAFSVIESAVLRRWPPRVIG
jgi:ABC-type nitrate/sulfonate/bicarbonate transport system permease component